MARLFKLFLLPFLVLLFVVIAIDELAEKLGPLRWAVRLVLLPLFIVSLPALVFAGGDKGAVPEGRAKLFPSVDLCFERGPWIAEGVFGTRFRLPTGGTVEFFRPVAADALDPDLKPALEKGFPLEEGVRWGGLRIRTFMGPEALSVFYVAQCDDRCLNARFEGTVEEEQLADALFGSMRRASTFTAPPATATPNMPVSSAMN
jgi:hypothetical protein